MVSVLIETGIESKEFPRGNLRPILGRPLIEMIIERIRYCNTVNNIVVVENSQPDENLQRLCDILSVPYYCEYEDNPLKRFYDAAQKHDADIAVRISANCPLIDPELVDEVVRLYLNNRKKYDYCSNIHPRTYPMGLDASVIPAAAMEKLINFSSSSIDMDEIGNILLRHPEEFRIGNVADGINRSMFRWLVNSTDDLQFVTEIYKALYKQGECFSRENVFELLRKHPELMAINTAKVKEKSIT